MQIMRITEEHLLDFTFNDEDCLSSENDDDAVELLEELVVMNDYLPSYMEYLLNEMSVTHTIYDKEKAVFCEILDLKENGMKYYDE